MMKIRPTILTRHKWTGQRLPAFDAWRAQVCALDRTSELGTELALRETELLPQFSRHYLQLRSLPRRFRRALRRKLTVSLGGAALLLTLGLDPTQAANINVSGGCTLVDAITAANTDAPTGSCPGGNGADTIHLFSPVTLNVVNDSGLDGPSGLPQVSSDITIEGNGNTIERASAAPDFRLFFVNGSGKLVLNDATVSGGKLVGSGAGVFNNNTLTLVNSTISGNTAFFGGGVYGYVGDVSIINSTISGNSADFDGGGISNRSASVVTITGSTISGNTAPYGAGISNVLGMVTVISSTISANTASSGGIDHGGGIRSLDGTVTITDSTISGNVANNDGGAVYMNDGTATITNSTISGNSAGDEGGGLFNALGTVTLTNSDISGNHAEYGGGITNRNSGVVTITNSTISGNSAVSAESRGGGVYNRTSGIVTISNSTIAGNYSEEYGGGIYSGSGLLTIVGSTISGNTADGDDGGGLYIDGGTATITDSTIKGNSARDSGGVEINGGAITVSITNSTISDNTARHGGGIRNFSSVPVTIANSTISGNTATVTDSGGIYNGLSSMVNVTESTITGNSATTHGGGLLNRGIFTVTNSTISGNSASFDGGGVYVNSGTVTVTNSTIMGNSATDDGAGVYIKGGTATITNSTISGNSATDDGGGVYNYLGNTTLTNSTITGNTAVVAGGVCNCSTGNVTLQQTILSGNTATGTGPSAVPELFNFAYGGGGTITANAHNIFGQNSVSGLFNVSAGGSDIVPSGPVGTILNPVLGDNGGPTKTHDLVLSSPAIDGATSGCPPPSVDQRGIVRPIGPACDIGAIELDPINLTPTADAGLDQVVNAGDVITLDGSSSSDPDGDPLAFSWNITGGMQGLPPNQATTGNPRTVIAPAAAFALTFELKVTDTNGASDTDSVMVTVSNRAPISNAGSDRMVSRGTTVILDATGSTDFDGDQLTYVWKQTGGPSVTLSGKTKPTATFTAPNSPATLTFQLDITDGRRGTSSATVTITVP